MDKWKLITGYALLFLYLGWGTTYVYADCQVHVTLEGCVYDSVTQQPIVGAIIRFDDEKWCKGGELFPGVTDSQGCFNMTRDCTVKVGEDMKVVPCIFVDASFFGYSQYSECLVGIPVVDNCVEDESRTTSIVFLDIHLSSMRTAVDSGSPTQILPNTFALEQNYPNPFNPTTTISYSLVTKADVTVTVYNILGEKIRVFDEGMKSAGRHSVTWDSRNENGKSVASGVYFYKVQAGELVASRKMLLLK